jgi:hypothetical protein
MLKRKVFGLLKDTLKRFVFDFKEEMLEVGLFSGNIELKNLIIRPNEVNKMMADKNLPVRLKAGMIAHIQIKVHALANIVGIFAQHPF